MSVTIYDVASLAHVSVTTISKILNHKDYDISAQTKQRVLNIIKEIDFVPCGLARSLVTKKTNTIGLMIPSITNQYFAEIARGVENGANSFGYNVIFCNTDEDNKKEREYFQLLQERSPDGIIMVPIQESEKLVTEEFKLDIPFMLLDRTYDDMDKNSYCVKFDNIKGGYTATKYLIKKGHRKIGIVTGSTKSKQSNDRLKGYKNALFDADIEIDPSLVYNGSFDYKSGIYAAEYFLKKNITAIFSTNDTMAFGIYKVFRENNIKIPGDISVVGYDNIPICNMLDPGLTTIAQPKLEMGRVAAENIIHLINKEGCDHDVMFGPKLIERESVKEI